MKRNLHRFLLFLGTALLCAGIAFVPCQAKPKAVGINVQYRTQKQIRKYVKSHKFSIKKKLAYARTPSVTAGAYDAGKLKWASMKNGLNALNTVRYIAGLPANVYLDDGYIKKCQAAALVNAANQELSHEPVMPEDMPEELFNLGFSGAQSSNLAWTVWSPNPAYSVLFQWMADDDRYNIDRLGHRRWILNPAMKKTGFGAVDHYLTMYAFDNVFGPTPYYGVVWPAQNMPVDYFESTMPWSVSMGSYVDSAEVKVTLTRERDGKRWVFSEKKSNGYFHVNNEGYGQTGCIIFRPNSISYAAGDKYTVKITGLSQPVSYEVKFFKL